MYNTNYDFAVNHEIQYFACTINGKEYKGYYSPDRIPTAEVPDGYNRYESRTSDTNSKLCSIEHQVIVNFGGTILLEDNIDFNDNIYLDFDDYTINDVHYQEFPQIFKEYDEATDKERKLIVEAVGGDNRNFKELVDNANEYHAFKLNISYKDADALVCRLNELDENEDDCPWYLGDCHEIYVDVD